MAQMNMIMSDNLGMNSDLPENNQINSASKSAKGMSPGMKVAVNAGVQIARQYAQKAITQVADLYGNKILENNINEGSKIASYGIQIATTGWVGVAMVAAEVSYDAIMNSVKDTQAKNKAEFARSSVGYVSTGAGRYGNE